MYRHSENSHAATVRRYYEFVDRSDIDGLVALFAEASEYRRPGYEPLRGHEQLRRFYLTERVISEGHHHLDAVLIDGESAATRGTFSGVLRDGRKVELRFADFFVFADDKFVYRETFFFAPLV